MAVRLVGVIQARMGSSRLPGKAMMALGDSLCIEHVYRRALQIRRLDGIVLATSTNWEDDSLAGWAGAIGLDVYRGSENNVARRVLEACQTQKGTHIARITGDCPLLDPVVCDDVINAGFAERADFACNYIPPSFPDGLDFSVFPAQNLEGVLKTGLSKFDREHVTTFFERNFNHTESLNYSSQQNLSGHRWTLDNPEDYRFLSALFNRLEVDGAGFGHLETLETLNENIHIAILQSKSRRNYGHHGEDDKRPRSERGTS